METGFKMPHEFALSIGESFAELLAYSADPAQATYRSRWYLPRKGVGDGLKEALKSLSIDETNEPSIRLTVATSAVERILAQDQGRPPALLVNAGFEGSAHLLNQFITPQFSFRSERRPLPIDNNLVFGVSGKIAPDGSELAPLRLEDLEQIVAKLELVNVRDVAIAFLHSTANPKHELQAAEFLRERGLRPFLSHAMEGTDKKRRAIEAAFAESAVIEEKEEIENALKPFVREWRVVGANGLKEWHHYSAATIRGGLNHALRKLASLEDGIVIHCGLDEFEVYVAGPERHLVTSRIRPTQMVVHGTWPFPYFSETACDYAPGPMLFGKSQVLAAVDTLFVCQHLKEIMGFTPLINEKSRPRILEALFTLAKSSDTAAKPEPIEVAQSLVRAFVEQVAVKLQLSLHEGALAQANSEVQLIGPLAETMRPLLTERRPDLKFVCTPDASWGETFAVAKACESRNGKSATESFG